VKISDSYSPRDNQIWCELEIHLKTVFKQHDIWLDARLQPKTQDAIPAIIAAEIMADLRAALEQFAAIAGVWRSRNDKSVRHLVCYTSKRISKGLLIMGKADVAVVFAQRGGFDLARSLIAYLREQTYDTWADSDVQPGVDWVQDLVAALTQRDVLIAVIGPGAQDSRWLQRKIDIARGAGLSILPIVQSGQYNFQDDPLFIRFFQPLDYHGQAWDAFPQLISSIDRLAKQAREKRRIRTINPDEITATPTFGQPVREVRFQSDAFMIMPFREGLNPVYEDFVKPTVQKAGLTIKRGDDPFSHHDIMREIWSLIYNARLVIADCTDRNPNVFYELGIAHTLGKPAIMITQRIEDVPFDVRGKRVLVYEYTPRGMQKLEEALKYALDSILSEIPPAN